TRVWFRSPLWTPRGCPRDVHGSSTALSTGRARPAWVPPGASRRLHDLDQGLDVVVDRLALLHEGADLVVGVDDGRVVAAAELPGDLGVAELGQLPEQVHADL